MNSWKSKLPCYVGVGTGRRRLHCYARNARAAVRMMREFGVSVAKRLVRPPKKSPTVFDARKAPGA